MTRLSESGELGLGTRIELLDSHHRNGGTTFVARVHELVRDLPGAEDDASNAGGVEGRRRSVVEDGSELAVGQLRHRRA